VRLNLDVDADLAELDLMRRRLANARGVLEVVADDLQTAQAERFTSVRFRPLTPQYAARKARRGLSTRPLAGGELERSVLGRGHYAVRRVGDDVAEVGTANPVARIHKAGTARMPKRAPVVSPTKRVRAGLTERIRAHVLDGR
jgi:phage gpG-like protein